MSSVLETLYYLIRFTCDGIMAVRAREKINSLDESDEINIGDEVMATWIGHDYKAIVIAISESKDELEAQLEKLKRKNGITAAARRSQLLEKKKKGRTILSELNKIDHVHVDSKGSGSAKKNKSNRDDVDSIGHCKRTSDVELQNSKKKCHKGSKSEHYDNHFILIQIVKESGSEHQSYYSPRKTPPITDDDSLPQLTPTTSDVSDSTVSNEKCLCAEHKCCSVDEEIKRLQQLLQKPGEYVERTQAKPGIMSICDAKKLKMIELIEGSGVYWSAANKQLAQSSTSTATGLTRFLVSTFFNNEVLKTSNAKGGGGKYSPLNQTIVQAITAYVVKMYSGTLPSTVIMCINNKCTAARRNTHIKEEIDTSTTVTEEI